MGLTIFWDFAPRFARAETPPIDEALMLFELPPADLPICPNEPLAAIGALRAHCLDLPFAEVSNVMHLKGEPARGTVEHALWDDADCRAKRIDDDVIPLRPLEVIGFTAWPGEDCETAAFFLARYPGTYWADGRRRCTGLPTWWGHGLCKTQYASNHGTEHFVRCHLSVIAALDEARRLGLLQEVQDEGLFWSRRDSGALVREVGEWNAMIAGLAGVLRDSLGSGVEAPILKHPSFERLEQTGVAGVAGGFIGAIRDGLEDRARDSGNL